MNIWRNVILVSCIFLLSTSISVGQEKVKAKLNSLVVPALSFVDTPLVDALSFVQQKSVELDPDNAGINVVILDPRVRNNQITLDLKNIPLRDAIRYTTMLAGAHMKITRYAVTVTSPKTGDDESARPNTKEIEKRMREIVLPRVEFRDTPLIDAIQYLTIKSSELDSTGNGGVNIVYNGDRKSDGQTPVSLHLSNIPIYETINYTVQLAGHRFDIEPNAIVISKIDS